MGTSAARSISLHRSRVRRVRQGRLELTLIFALAGVVLFGCATVSDRDGSEEAVTQWDSSMIDTHPMLIIPPDLAIRGVVAYDLVDATLGAASAEAGRDDGLQWLESMFESGDLLFFGIDLDDGFFEEPEFRIAASGDFPVARVFLASLFSRRIERIRYGLRWYVLQEEGIAFTFPDRKLLVAAREPVSVAADSAIGRLADHDQAADDRWFAGIDTTEASARLAVRDSSLVGKVLAGAGIPPEISRQLVMRLVRIELGARVPDLDESSGSVDRYPVTIELVAERPLQARLIGAGLRYAIQASGSNGVVEVSEEEVTVSGIWLTVEQSMALLRGYDGSTVRGEAPFGGLFAPGGSN